MLEDYIAQCEVVVHFVGDMAGSAPVSVSVHDLLARHPGLEERLAIAFDKGLVIVAPAEGVSRGPEYAPTDTSRASQAEHSKRLKAIDRYPCHAFTGADNLVAQIFASAVLDALAKAEANPSPAGAAGVFFGDTNRAIADRVHHRPSADEIQQRVPALATKLAILAGMNRSLAAAMQADGPTNTNWMYDILYKMRGEIKGVFDLIYGIDAVFGSNNNHLMADLEARMNVKVFLLDKVGRKVELEDAGVRRDLGRMLAEQADVLIGLSDQIVTARKEH